MTKSFDIPRGSTQQERLARFRSDIDHEVKMEQWRSRNRIAAAIIIVNSVIGLTIWQKVCEKLETPGPLDIAKETADLMSNAIEGR